MYWVIVENDGETTHEWFKRKKDMVAFIAKEIGETKRSVDCDVPARTSSLIKRDQRGIRVKIEYAQ